MIKFLQQNIEKLREFLKEKELRFILYILQFLLPKFIQSLLLIKYFQVKGNLIYFISDFLILKKLRLIIILSTSYNILYFNYFSLIDNLY